MTIRELSEDVINGTNIECSPEELYNSIGLGRLLIAKGTLDIMDDEWLPYDEDTSEGRGARYELDKSPTKKFKNMDMVNEFITDINNVGLIIEETDDYIITMHWDKYLKVTKDTSLVKWVYDKGDANE